MPVQESDRSLVERASAAMHSGPDGERVFVGLFHEDAVVIEPFSGSAREHRGHAAIAAWFREAVADIPPDMEVVLDRIDMDGGLVRADWTCTSSHFSRPLRGYDLYTNEGGRIRRLEMVMTQAPSGD